VDVFYDVVPFERCGYIDIRVALYELFRHYIDHGVDRVVKVKLMV